MTGPLARSSSCSVGWRWRSGSPGRRSPPPSTRLMPPGTASGPAPTSSTSSVSRRSATGPPQWIDRRRRSPSSVLGRAVPRRRRHRGRGRHVDDQANGGRLHPEQWFGLAAVVCGAGLVIGTVRGHARWLVAPTLAFAAAALPHHADGPPRHGIDDAARGPLGVDGDGTAGGLRAERVGIGNIDIEVSDVPDDVVTIDARSALGDVHVRAAANVTVEVRSDVDDGAVRFDGVTSADGVIRLGGGERPDVIVNARVGRGDVVVSRYDAPVRRDARDDPGRGSVDRGRTPHLGDRYRSRPRPTAGSCSPTARPSWTRRTRSSSVRSCPASVASRWCPRRRASCQLLPRSLLITPFGEVLDLQRSRRAGRPTRRPRRCRWHPPPPEDDRGSHPIDPLSAVLGVVTITVGILVMTDTWHRIDDDGGWWFAVGALVVGLGLIPWNRASSSDEKEVVEMEEPAGP